MCFTSHRNNTSYVYLQVINGTLMKMHGISRRSDFLKGCNVEEEEEKVKFLISK